MPVEHREQRVTRKPCSTYGLDNKCEGMTCEADNQCSSSCCGQLTSDGSKTCHALIEGQFCPRAVAPKVDYTHYGDNEDWGHRNDILRTVPSNEMPSYRGQDGCKVHGQDDQCDG